MEWEVLQHGVRVLIDNPSQWDTLISIAEKFWMILSYGSILLSPKNFDKCDVMFNGGQIQFSVPLTGTWLYTVLCSCTEWEKKLVDDAHACNIIRLIHGVVKGQFFNICVRSAGSSRFKFLFGAKFQSQYEFRLRPKASLSTFYYVVHVL